MIKRGEAFVCVKTVIMDGNPSDVAYESIERKED